MEEVGIERWVATPGLLRRARLAVRYASGWTKTQSSLELVDRVVSGPLNQPIIAPILVSSAPSPLTSLRSDLSACGRGPSCTTHLRTDSRRGIHDPARPLGRMQRLIPDTSEAASRPLLLDKHGFMETA
jgi:hypothetical protein